MQDLRSKDGTFAKGRKIEKQLHPRWKGGLPKCKCGVILSTRTTKTNLCRKCFLKTATAEKAGHWKGGRKNNNGYVMIFSPQHPFSDQQGYVREHRLVIEKKLKRFLEKNEVVHHKNGVRNDNRITNLEILSKKQHDKLTYFSRNLDKKGRLL